jgi:hypothetical protein
VSKVNPLYPPDAEQSCLNCMYLRNARCRRNAPVVFAEPATNYTYSKGFWPVVKDGDWCGEWVSAEEGL